MKTNDFLPLDDVADSMQAAAARLGVPIQAVKQAKRNGSDAFRGSRVHVGKLAKELTTQKEAGAAGVLLIMVKEVARIVANKLPHSDARFIADSQKLTEQIHLGFACALVVIEPDAVDTFLRGSAALMENIFKSTRKKLPRVEQSRNNGSEKLRKNNENKPK
jgi:hypothetical protein